LVNSSVVGAASRLRAGFRVPAQVREFSVLQIVQTDIRSHSDSSIIGRVAVSGGNATGA